MPASLAAAVAFSIAATALAAPPLPLPFTRILHLVSPPLGGGDIVILQNLLHRSDGCAFALPRSHAGDYDAATARAVSCFQTHVGLAADGVVGPNTARALLRTLSADGWRDDGRSAGEQGYKYKILLPVHTNRSVETVGTLLDAHNNELLRFPAHSHGHDCDEDGQRIDGIPWPDLTDDGCPDAALKQGCIGLNEFSSDGATPTGLTEIDLNSPESASDERLYGPYPVNRFVRGVLGNAAFLMPNIRDGILIHSGEWANYSSWHVGQPMPNSAGCVHSYLPSIKQIWQVLVAKCGVEVRPNTGGRRPYPYKPQGIVAVYNVGSGPRNSTAFNFNKFNSTASRTV